MVLTIFLFGLGGLLIGGIRALRSMRAPLRIVRVMALFAMLAVGWGAWRLVS